MENYAKNDDQLLTKLQDWFTEIKEQYSAQGILLNDSEAQSRIGVPSQEKQLKTEKVIRTARKMGFQDKKLNNLILLAKYHDIGKVGIADRILHKPGPLSPEEREEMQRHCEMGYNLALAAPDLEPIAVSILSHHEWWNGQGYPMGLQGEEIPLECRILAIADAYDAMTHDRPYRKAMAQEAAIKELIRCRGSQFDPKLVDLFIEELAV